MKNKKYIVYDDYNIGYISKVCTCIKCKERGRSETFINDLEGEYLECIESNEISNIIYLGDSLVEAVNEMRNNFKQIIEKKDRENQCLQNLINHYTSL